MKNKKAFTVVELVIVIAIIAILAAVLIPTFASIIKKANISKDQQLIRNLNTALVSDRADNGGKNHRNMTEALEAAEKFGYEVGKINASGTDNEILWDSKNDVFCYYDAEKKTVEYIPSSVSSANIPEKDSTDYWCIITEKNVDEAFITDSQTGVTTLSCGKEEAGNAMKWSCYLAAVKSGVTAITTATGVDVGETTDLETINYVNSAAAQTVIIRTNSSSTELIVDAPQDTVKHYDMVGTVHVIAVDPDNCYEENGKAAFTQIDSGKYTTTETAEVELLFVTDSAVKVDVVPGTVHHAHAISKAAADLINGTKPGVIFDYDENGDQADLDVHHHVNDGDKLGFTNNFSSNKDQKAVADAVDILAGKEIKSDPNFDSYVARIGTKGFLTFAEAYDTAVSGDTIVLLKNIVLGEVIEGNFVQEDCTSSFDFKKASLTLDLNGNSLVSNVTTNIGFYIIAGADLTIKDGIGGGMLLAPNAQMVIYCVGTINIYGGTIQAQYALGMADALRVKGTANIYGGNISSLTEYYYPDFGYFGNNALNNCGKAYIYGGSFSCKVKNAEYNGAIANCGSLYIMNDITTEGLYWSNDGSGKSGTIISVTDGKTLTVDGAYMLNQANSKPITLVGNAVYTDENGQVVTLYTEYDD